MPEMLGDQPIQEEYRNQMVDIAAALDDAFNGQVGGPGRKVGFILMVFPFDEHEGRCNYISNGANRRDVIALMKEQIARFEGQPEMVPGKA